MNLQNANVLLTMKVEGAHKPWFVFSERKQKYFRVFNPDINPGHDCQRVINLNEAFVNHSISDKEGRIGSHMRYAHDNWRKLTQSQRLEAHLADLAIALVASTFTYKDVKSQTYRQVKRN